METGEKVLATSAHSVETVIFFLISNGVETFERVSLHLRISQNNCMKVSSLSDAVAANFSMISNLLFVGKASAAI